MGMQGPLTAQALGRSPYDPEPAEGEGEESTTSPNQQYDARGRPKNPETKRINRDIIRAHNEVMLAVGVAEAENPTTAAEHESNRQHDAYETNIGIRLIWASKRCIEMVGVFGVNGLRQRILIYKEFSHTPCYDLFQFKLRNISWERDILAGAPSSFLANAIWRRFLPPYIFRVIAFSGQQPNLMHYCTYAFWTYLKTHLELYAAFQRLGLISGMRILPSWKFFVPFGGEALISKPPPLKDFTPHSLLQWFGGACVSAAPFLIWTMTQKLSREWRALFWDNILGKLPNPMTRGRHIPLPPDPPEPEDLEPPSPVIETQPSAGGQAPEQSGPSSPAEEPQATREDGNAAPPSTPAEQEVQEEDIEPLPQPELHRRQSTHSVTGADDFASDEEDNDFLSSNVFRFEVEATEATGPNPPGELWSAELRPSAEPGDSSAGPPPTTYLSTMLTRLPSVTAAAILADSCVRLIVVPYEATALRLAARAFCAQHGLSTAGMFALNMFDGLNLTWAVNFLGTELSYLVLSGEVWSVASGLSSWLHLSEEEWKDYDGKDWGDWLGIFRSYEPLY